ncbi:carboxylesterase family protein [[Actinomadura] parvosata]|uniref:carboxylesterase family protein n=1 Tax=[Actinomadura] parvosata TaxID=1955412 RepID=UPI001646AC4A
MTQSGPVAGIQKQGVSSVRGIAYAAAPIGSRRFLPPAPPRKWTEPKDASRLEPGVLAGSRRARGRRGDLAVGGLPDA